MLTGPFFFLQVLRVGLANTQKGARLDYMPYFLTCEQLKTVQLLMANDQSSIIKSQNSETMNLGEFLGW